ncbi:MAG: CDGSH iron-sulfur domain-containing protein, partial [Acidobacteriota bacterium]
MGSDGKRTRPTIACAEDGPYRVKGLKCLTDSKGQEISTKKTMALCRCGASRIKPFCDGTHAKTDFSGRKLTDGALDKRDSYVGKRITIHDNRGLCAHAAEC